jgi:hypothetical protein
LVPEEVMRVSLIGQAVCLILRKIAGAVRRKLQEFYLKEVRK